MSWWPFWNASCCRERRVTKYSNSLSCQQQSKQASSWNFSTQIHWSTSKVVPTRQKCTTFSNLFKATMRQSLIQSYRYTTMNLWEISWSFWRERTKLWACRRDYKKQTKISTSTIFKCWCCIQPYHMNTSIMFSTKRRMNKQGELYCLPTLLRLVWPYQVSDMLLTVDLLRLGLLITIVCLICWRLFLLAKPMHYKEQGVREEKPLVNATNSIPKILFKISNSTIHLKYWEVS